MLLDVSDRHKKTFPVELWLIHTLHQLCLLCIRGFLRGCRMVLRHVFTHYKWKARKTKCDFAPPLSLNRLDSPIEPAVVILLHSCVSLYHARVYHGVLALKHKLINPCQPSVCLQTPLRPVYHPHIAVGTTWCNFSTDPLSDWQKIENSIQIFICRKGNSVIPAALLIRAAPKCTKDCGRM